MRRVVCLGSTSMDEARMLDAAAVDRAVAHL
jgi:hypothetical protein